jgi:hypothetical protein
MVSMGEEKGPKEKVQGKGTGTNALPLSLFFE